MADKHGYEWGTGRRKCSVARVRIKKGTGKITVNGRDYLEYFPSLRLRKLVEGPLKQVDLSAEYDVFASIRGGGMTGQAGALMMGLGRAIVKVSEEYKPSLSTEGYLSRDSRMVERKKPGKPGARRSFQFSKR
ncbi:MAG: 30S ribosomal protein S9 [Planctomycetaceae bacterium]|nr:30S ribosomal protein S9 [Planctomycetaceae bacterium]